MENSPHQRGVRDVERRFGQDAEEGEDGKRHHHDSESAFAHGAGGAGCRCCPMVVSFVVDAHGSPCRVGVVGVDGRRRYPHIVLPRLYLGRKSYAKLHARIRTRPRLRQCCL